jgi:hypothetical protein
VDLDLAINQPLSDPVEVAAYYVVAEALTNAAKHAQASEVAVSAHSRGARLHVSVRDNGVGGAQLGKGSGLIGLKDRLDTSAAYPTRQSARRRDVAGRHHPAQRWQLVALADHSCVSVGANFIRSPQPQPMSSNVTPGRKPNSPNAMSIFAICASSSVMSSRSKYAQL